MGYDSISQCKDLLYNLLDVDPKTRYTAEQALNHPWVSGRIVQPNSYLASPRCSENVARTRAQRMLIKARLDNIRSEMEKGAKEEKRATTERIASE